MGILTTNYEIIKEIGRGGTGTVHLAKDKRLDRMVAVKMLQIDMAFDEDVIAEIIQRFHKEARAIARLNHPNIVDIYDFGEENGNHFMVIELLHGQSLSETLIKKIKLPVEIIISIGVQLCDALSYAHKNGIVHRDIKPANIIISEDHQVKLTDFGIAQLGNDKLVLTQAGSILGSILYIPPEQLVDSRQVDKRADIYSLGVTLYQLFTGRLPFEGTSVGEVITKILNQEVLPMRTFNSQLPEALDRVIMKAMKKEPDERYSEISLFGEALSEIGEYLKSGSNIPKININDTLGYNKASEEVLGVKLDKKNDLVLKKNKSPKGIIITIIILLITFILSLSWYFKSHQSKNNKPTNIKPSIINVVPSKPPIKKVIINKAKPIKKVIKKVIIKPKNIIKKPIIKKIIVTKPIKKIIHISKPIIVKKHQAINTKKAITKHITTVKPSKHLGEGY